MERAPDNSNLVSRPAAQIVLHLSAVFGTDVIAVAAGLRLDLPDRERADAEGVAFLEITPEV